MLTSGGAPQGSVSAASLDPEVGAHHNVSKGMHNGLHIADYVCRMAPTTKAMRTELAGFAEQVARFTWQYRHLDLLWKVTEVLCPSYVPAASTALLEVVKAVRECCPFKHRCTAPWILHKLITQVALFGSFATRFVNTGMVVCLLVLDTRGRLSRNQVLSSLQAWAVEP